MRRSAVEQFDQRAGTICAAHRSEEHGPPRSRRDLYRAMDVSFTSRL